MVKSLASERRHRYVWKCKLTSLLSQRFWPFVSSGGLDVERIRRRPHWYLPGLQILLAVIAASPFLK